MCGIRIANAVFLSPMESGPRVSESTRHAEWQERDEALMHRYADGDTDAFKELFRRYEPRACAFFLKRTGSRQRSCSFPVWRSNRSMRHQAFGQAGSLVLERAPTTA